MAFLQHFQRIIPSIPVRYALVCSIKEVSFKNRNMKLLNLDRAILQMRMLSTSKTMLCSSSNVTTNLQTEDEFRLVYEGPLSRRIKFLKLFSFTTGAVSLGAPAIIFMSHSTLAVVAKVILASTVCIMGVTTTSLLHWLTRVYVYRMFFQPQTRTFSAETSSIFGTTKRHTFSVEDITIPEIEHAFSTFEAKGNRYFIHVELKEAEQILKYVREYNFESL